MQPSYQDFMWFSAIRGFKVTLPRAKDPADTFVAAHRGNIWRETLVRSVQPRNLLSPYLHSAAA
jgi:hypothetical protein